MSRSRYKTVCFEGGDQVGKGDAVMNFSNEVSSLGYDASVISFPYYATPLGYIIRNILVNGFPAKMNLPLDREIEIKMLLFALNRLEILDCLLNMKDSNQYILDRGPFSNALTIGYHIFQNPQEEKKKEELAKKAINFDSYFRKVFNIDNCVICLRHKDTQWSKSRKDRGDLHERKEVQDISEEVYNVFEEEIKDGWKNVVTKDINGWKERKDIKKECIEFALSRGVIEEKENKKEGNLYYLGIEDIQKVLYLGSQVEDPLKDAWMNCIKCNDKKEVYRVSEQISNALAATTELLQWKDSGIKGYICTLLSNYPEIFAIIEYQYGKDFKNKFEKSLR